MKTFTKEFNGRKLTIQVNDEAIRKSLNDLVSLCDDVREDMKNGFDLVEALREHDMPYEKVGSYEEYVQSIEDVENDYKGLLDALDKALESDLFSMMEYKANGTFHKGRKPILETMTYGTYYDDSYGWYHDALRLEASSDVDAELKLVSICTHY